MNADWDHEPRLVNCSPAQMRIGEWPTIFELASIQHSLFREDREQTGHDRRSSAFIGGPDFFA
jgi:hypothetical protein